MRLHWSSRSPFVRKVMVVAHECGLADRIERVPTLVRLAQPNAALLPLNPLSQLPTLVLPDGTALFDSDVICRYLDAEGGGCLFPAGDWAALRWNALGSGLTAVLLQWRTERERPAPDPALIGSFTAKAAAACDRMAAEAPAIAAAPFAIGHVALGCALGYLDFRFGGFAWREGRPALAAWHAAFEARESARATAHVDA